MWSGLASPQPVLETERLRLRPFEVRDAVKVAKLAGARDVADTTVSVPHPYPVLTARAWIESHPRAWETDSAAHFAVELRSNRLLLGCVSVRHIDRAHYDAEIGFWVGRAWWSCGYAREGAAAVVAFAFGPLGMNRLHAHHLVRNPASGRVLKALGFREEGCLRERVQKCGRFEDVTLQALLRREWLSAE